jgi:hypothetical protein
VSCTPSAEHLGIDSASVVANPHKQGAISIFKLTLNLLSSRMAEGVGQGLSANAVEFMLDGEVAAVASGR